MAIQHSRSNSLSPVLDGLAIMWGSSRDGVGPATAGESARRAICTECVQVRLEVRQFRPLHVSRSMDNSAVDRIPGRLPWIPLPSGPRPRLVPRSRADSPRTDRPARLSVCRGVPSRVNQQPVAYSLRLLVKTGTSRSNRSPRVGVRGRRSIEVRMVLYRWLNVCSDDRAGGPAGLSGGVRRNEHTLATCDPARPNETTH